MDNNSSFSKSRLVVWLLSIVAVSVNSAVLAFSDKLANPKITKDVQLAAQNDLQKYLQGLQVSGALGFSQLNINRGGDTFAGPEHDTIVTKRATRQLNLKVGLGYNLFSEQLARNKFLNNLLVELNFYRFSGAAYGKVYQYDDSSVSNDIDSKLSIKSSERLMLDIKPSLFTTSYGLSPYLVFGAGFGWVKTEYQEFDNTIGIPRTSGGTTNKKFVIEGGGGISYTVNKHIALSLEYLFTHFGKIVNGNAQYTDPDDGKVYIQDAPVFTNMYTNTVLLGLSVKI